jgi:fibronectin-binding autotransporter adhesin
MRKRNHRHHPVNRPLALTAAAGLAALLATPAALAANLFWDANGETGGTGGVGTWDTTSSLWRLDSDVGSLQTYTNTVGDMTANFGGTAGAVTILSGLTVNANAVNFTTSGYTIQQGNASSFLNLDGTTPTITTSLLATGVATISAKISGSAGLTKTGTGILSLGGANTYTGTTTVAGGILRALDGTGLNSQNLLLSGGAYDPNTTTAFVRSLGSGTNQVQLVASGANASTGFASTANTLKTIAIGGTGSPTTLVWGSEFFSPSTGTGSFILNGGTVNTVDIKNSIDLNDSASAVTRNISGTGSAILSGDLTQSGGGATKLVKTGAGTLRLLGNNSFSGGFEWVDANTFVLVLGSDTALGSGLVTLNSTTGAVTVQAADATDRVLTNDLSIAENDLRFGSTTTTTGNLTFGGLAQTAVGHVITINNAKTTFSSYSATGGTFTKSGTGAMIVTGNFTRGSANTFTIANGALAVGGTWNVNTVATLGSTTSATTAVLGRNGSMTGALGATEGVRWAAGTSLGGGLFAYGTNGTWGNAANNLTVNFGGSGAALAWGQANFVQSGQTLIFGNTVSNGTVTFENAIDLNAAARTIQVDAGATNPGTGSDAILSGLLSNGGLTKTGSGTLTISANNSYTGATDVNEGKLVVNGNQSTATGAVTVASGASLGGSGTIGGAVTVNGSLAPGNSIGTINTGDLGIGATGALDVELGRDTGTPTSDRTNVTGTVGITSGADLKLTLYAGLTNPEVGDIFYLISNDGSDVITGEFTKLNGTDTTLNEGSLFSWNSQDWQITYAANHDGSSFTGGNDLAIKVVPEPAALALLCLGAVGLLRRRRGPAVQAVFAGR